MDDLCCEVVVVVGGEFEFYVCYGGCFMFGGCYDECCDVLYYWNYWWWVVSLYDVLGCDWIGGVYLFVGF